MNLPLPRPLLAERRLRNILTTHIVALARTLEQKISDAGPTNQRIDPHILTPARQRLQEAGEVIPIQHAGTVWYYLSNPDPTLLSTRLDEQAHVHTAFCHHATAKRTGQALEIAVFRALASQTQIAFLGHYPDLDAHDDSSLYQKEEPPSAIGTKRIPGKRKLDFILGSLARPLGVEVKNIRPWLYPNATDIREFLLKCCALDAVPVLIARRIPFVTFRLLHPCGVILHQTYNQRLAKADSALADQAKNKRLLGFHDIRVGNDPEARLTRFIHDNLPAISDDARRQYDLFKDLLCSFADGSMRYKEFAARVRRRAANQPEDYDEDQLDPHSPNDFL